MLHVRKLRFIFRTKYLLTTKCQCVFDSNVFLSHRSEIKLSQIIGVFIISCIFEDELDKARRQESGKICTAKYRGTSKDRKPEKT